MPYTVGYGGDKTKREGGTRFAPTGRRTAQMTPKQGHRQTLRGKFLRVTIPLIFLTVIGVFAVVEMMTHRNA